VAVALQATGMGSGMPRRRLGATRSQGRGGGGMKDDPNNIVH
jgi:hypothetical protein